MSFSSITSAEFFAVWKHSLSADFQQNGVSARSEPWVTETTKIAMNDRPGVAALSDDNSLLAVGVGHEIYVYDMAAPALLRTLPGRAGYTIEELEFQPRGRKIAAGSEKRHQESTESIVQVWDLDAPSKPPEQLDDAVKAAVTAASSILLQHWSVEDLESVNLQTKITEIFARGQVAVDARNGHILLGKLPSFESRPFSHDGRSLLYLPDRRNVAVLDVDTLTVRFRLSDHTGAVMWAETSPDDKVVATSSWDKTVRIWSMETGEVIHVLEGATIQSWAGAFSPDGELIAAGAGDKMARIWRVDTGELLHTLGGFGDWVRSLSFSPDNLHLAAGAGKGTLRVFNVGSGESEQTWQIDIETHQHAGSFTEVSGVRYTPGGDLFFHSSEGRVFGYRASGNLKWEAGEGVPWGWSPVSRDGSMLLTPLRDGPGVRVWKIDQESL
ncbi:Wd-40 repeat protein [Mycena venus]|uniref:Wd-40 repeat protein n=1 Tax=Mycena venus TaxID=2733690 RepID=A0A8H6XRG3_9AGAR|nr:Wd-40 repeat protein [Mycena venus]